MANVFGSDDGSDQKNDSDLSGRHPLQLQLPFSHLSQVSSSLRLTGQFKVQNWSVHKMNIFLMKSMRIMSLLMTVKLVSMTMKKKS